MAVLIVLAVAHLLNDLIQSLIPALYPVFKDDFALDFVQIGVITFTFQIGGLFYGLNFGLAGIAAAGIGGLADSIGIEAVYQLCAFLPLAGVLTWFLPRIEER